MAADPPVRFRIKGTKVYMAPFTDAVGGTVSGQSSNTPYAAAGSGRRAATWYASAAGPNAALAWSLNTLRMRSRDAVRQNPFAESAVSVLETNLIGTGIKPQWNTGDSGLDRELAELFREWTDESDADARLDFYGQQMALARGIIEAGELFARFRVRRPGDMDTVPLQLQLLEPEYCPVNWHQPNGGNRVNHGIEFDAIDRRVAYWLHRQHPNDLQLGRPIGALPVRVPAQEVMHLALPRRPGAIRGEPWLTRGLIKLRDMDDFDDATVMRQKLASLFTGFVTVNDEAPNPSGGSDTVIGEGDTDADGNAVATWEAGELHFLRPNEEITFPDIPEVGSTYEAFMRQQLRAEAVAIGVMYEQLTGDYSQLNDRTYRAGVNEFRRRVTMLQHHLVVFQFCRPVVRRWLDVAILSGAIDPPQGMELRRLRRIEWVPQGWHYIHPVQEVDAEIKAIRAGLQSRKAAVSARGDDIDTVDQEIADDNARSDDLGTRYDSDGRYPMTGPQPRKDADTAGDDETDASQERVPENAA